MRQIIIDTDPGIDDALALALAAGSPAELNILGITAVAGNVPLSRTAPNAAGLADFLSIDCPVGKGASGPLWRRDTVPATAVHGGDGLGGFALPQSVRPLEPALPLMVRLILESPEPVTVVGIGPLTNIASLIIHYPEVASQVERFVLMAGGTGTSTGNVTAAAEFNVYYDPDAAARVFDFGVPITMVGLNVTERALVGWHHLSGLEESGGPVAKLVQQLMGSYRSRATGDGMAQHDSLALASLIDPLIVTTEPRHVDVENTGRLTAGMTLVDWRRTSRAETNCDVAVDLNLEAFRHLLDDRLTALDQSLLDGKNRPLPAV